MDLQNCEKGVKGIACQVTVHSGRKKTCCVGEKYIGTKAKRKKEYSVYMAINKLVREKPAVELSGHQWTQIFDEHCLNYHGG